MLDQSSGKQPRILLFTGKGGVGKTTVAAATALRAAVFGYRTLVISADPAHSLADALDRRLGPEPQQVAPNLYGQEIDLYYSMKKYWGNLRELLLQVLKWQNMDDIMAEELAALPGMGEGAVFLWIEKFFRKKEFDLIVIDSAPTAETMTFLTLPQVSRWWMERVFPFQRFAAKTFGPMIRVMTRIPVNEGYDEMENLYEKLLEAHQLLSNPELSSIRLVLNPERMVIQEARRAYTYLQLYGYPVDAIIVNRVLPEESSDLVFGEYLKAQKRYLREIEDGFFPLPIFRVPHLGKEVLGISLLREIATRLYGETDPAKVFFKEKPFRLTDQDGAYLLEIRLPFVEEEDVSVVQRGDELVIQLKNQRRNLFLPRFLAYYTAREVSVEKGWLRVRFEKA